MPLASRKYTFPGLNHETYKGLPAVFADSLPDDFGNAVINAWLARQGRSADSFTALERLLYSGSGGMGALEYSPAMRERGRNPTGNFEMASLIAMAQRVLDQRAHLAVESEDVDGNGMEAIFQLGTSAGGARAKVIVAVNQTRTSIRSGQLTAPKGYEHYLLKFDGVAEKSNRSQTFGDPKGYGLME
jgi:serine/threonine-protein kinase HipA